MICNLFIACAKVETNYNVEGKLQSKIMYKGGKKNGPAVFYYNNGKKSLEANYKNDELDGKLVRYYSTGDIETEENLFSVFPVQRPKAAKTAQWRSGI